MSKWICFLLFLSLFSCGGGNSVGCNETSPATPGGPQRHHDLFIIPFTNGTIVVIERCGVYTYPSGRIVKVWAEENLIDIGNEVHREILAKNPAADTDTIAVPYIGPYVITADAPIDEYMKRVTTPPRYVEDPVAQWGIGSRTDDENNDVSDMFSTSFAFR